MSAQELDRLTVIEHVLEKRLSLGEAGKQLGVTPRHLRRMIERYCRDGAAGFVSKKRGKRSNNAYSGAVKNAVIALVRQRYHDFGSTLITEKLAEKHDIQLSSETVRRWLREAGIWKDRRQRRKRVHQPRYRRESLSELIQIDGSHHRWFEDRGLKCTLLVYIDDATGRLMELRFTDSESTIDYFHSTRRYLEQHGKSVAFYFSAGGSYQIIEKIPRAALGVRKEKWYPPKGKHVKVKTTENDVFVYTEQQTSHKTNPYGYSSTEENSYYYKAFTFDKEKKELVYLER